MLASGRLPLVAAALLFQGADCAAAAEPQEETSLLSVKRAGYGSPPCLTPYVQGNRMFQACCGGLEWASDSDHCVPSGQACQADGDICRDNAGRGPCCSGSCMGADEECQAGNCTCTADPRVKVPVNGTCRYTLSGDPHANVYPCTDGTTCESQVWTLDMRELGGRAWANVVDGTTGVGACELSTSA